MTPFAIPSSAELLDQAFDEGAFRFIAELAKQEAGLTIPRDKGTMVFARLNKRLKALGLADYDSYCALLRRDDAGAERKALISVLTTNVTSFMREQHHFDTLRDDILPTLVETGRKGGRVRLWSAGCSSGQEPYTMAMTVLDSWPDAHRHDLRILATDIDFRVLEKAREGLYPTSSVETLPDAWRQKYLEPVDDGRLWRINRQTRALVTFRELNLMKTWPFSGKFDVIFCRNVVIYFDQDTQNALWPRFQQACHPGGTLFIGHSEKIEPGSNTDFQMIGKTTYRRPCAPRTA